MRFIKYSPTPTNIEMFKNCWQAGHAVTPEVSKGFVWNLTHATCPAF